MAELEGPHPDEQDQEVGAAPDADGLFQPRPSQRIPGVREGTFVYGDGSGHFYFSSREKSGKRYLCCVRVKHGCRARATMELGIGDPIIPTATSPLHNHERDTLRVPRSHFVSQLKQRAATERTKISEIFEDEALRHPEAARSTSKLNAHRAMFRAKKSVEPAGTPRTLQDTREQLMARGVLAKTRDGLEEFLFAEEFLEGGEPIAMGFGSRRITQIMQEHPGEANHLFMDATFKVVPRQPERLRQLFSIHVLFRNVVFPVAFFLMQSKIEEHYRKILDYVKENIITWHIAHVTTDFERGLMNAVYQVWPSPGTQHHGCWFHFCQSIWRAVVNYGLARAGREDQRMKRIIKLIMAIPHLPAERGSIHSDAVPPFSVADGLEAVVQYAEEEQLNNEGLLNVFAYVRRYWLGARVGARQLSVFRLPARTNNAVESFHAKLLAAFGPHLNIFEFIGGLQRIEQEAYFNVLRGDAILEVNRIRSRSGRLSTLTITRSMDCLVRGQVTLIEFLRRVSHQTGSLFGVLSHALQAEDGLMEEELEVLQQNNEFWIGLDIGAEEDIPMQQAVAVPAAAVPAPPALAAVVPAPAAAVPAPPVPAQRPRGQSRGRRGQPRGARGRSRTQGRVREQVQVNRFGRCAICYDQDSTHAAIPCGHICMCTRCAHLNRQHNINALRCPLCNIPSREFLRMWASDAL